MRISKLQKIILRDLFGASEGLDAYTFWRRYRISPIELLKAVRYYLAKDFLKFENDRFFLTKEGRAFLLKNRFGLSVLDEKSWKQCPEQFKQIQLKIGKPIAPNITKLDKEFFNQNSSKIKT